MKKIFVVWLTHFVYFFRWVNHIVHTNVLICSTVEAFTSDCKYPSTKYGISFVVSAFTFYNAWIYYVWREKKYFIYPILDGLNVFQMVGFFTNIYLMATLFYKLGEYINRTMWNRRQGVPLSKYKLFWVIMRKIFESFGYLE